MSVFLKFVLGHNALKHMTASPVCSIRFWRELGYLPLIFFIVMIINSDPQWLATPPTGTNGDRFTSHPGGFIEGGRCGIDIADQ